MGISVCNARNVAFFLPLRVGARQGLFSTREIALAPGFKGHHRRRIG